MTASVENEKSGVPVPEEFVPALKRLFSEGGTITKDGYVPFPPDQPPTIRVIVIAHRGEETVGFSVGTNGVTRIEQIEKDGMYCAIPYLRVWKGDAVAAEFCQHSIVGAYFEGPP